MEKFKKICESLISEAGHTNSEIEKEQDYKARKILDPQKWNKVEQTLPLDIAILLYLRRNDIKQGTFAQELAIDPSNFSKLKYGKFAFKKIDDAGTTNSNLKLGHELISAFLMHNKFIEWVNDNKLVVNEFQNMPKDKDGNAIIHKNYVQESLDIDEVIDNCE